MRHWRLPLDLGKFVRLMEKESENNIKLRIRATPIRKAEMDRKRYLEAALYLNKVLIVADQMLTA